MLKDKSSAAIVAVSDLDRARAFYSDTLGLDLQDQSMGDVLTFRTGDTSLIVYRSDFAGTNKANAVVWGVGDEIDAIVADLRRRVSSSSTTTCRERGLRATSMSMAA